MTLAHDAAPTPRALPQHPAPDLDPAPDLAPDLAPALDPDLDLDLDLAVRPQDDFHRFANGRWSEAFVLPAHRAEASMLTLLADKVQDDVAALVHRAVTGPRSAGDVTGRQIADLYTSFMDEDRIEQRGAAAFQADLDSVRSAAGRQELARVLGRLQAQGVGGAVDFAVSTDTAQASQYVLILSQGGLGLPAAAQYQRADSWALREQYAAHVRVMLAHAGLPDPSRAAAEVLRLETDLAAGHTPAAPAAAASAKPQASLVADLAAHEGGFPWAPWLQGLGQVRPQATVWVRQPAFLAALDSWWHAHDLDSLKLWLTWRYVHEMVPFGPREVFADNFSFYAQALKGFTRPRPRPMRAISFVETFLGDAVGERYLTEHLAPGTLDAAAGLVDRLVRSYRTRLQQATWMQESTRAAALRKLDGMVFEIGFPRNAEARTDPWVDPADLIGNVKRGRARHIERELAKLGTPVDRSDWKVTPQAVTAYYRHGLNQVVIPAALLQPPIFSPDGDPARNFALLGSIVCHEMSHAFDSRGSRYDERGRLRDWWAPQDRAEFARRTALLVAQCDRYEPRGFPGHTVSGTRTVGENIADITGLTVAQGAFADHLAAGPRAPRRRGEAARTEQVQRFLLHWASMWRAKSTPERMLERLATDRHAPAEFRCNGVLGNVEAFYQAFDVHQGDRLYIAPQARFALV
ncbi:putative endopeptidase [Streptacidiphilus sp. MAP12-16]|uniref:M13-type metalloendopeptidase n=1 Tax=Streptacidiphilus sp. MAP12-16 TaxID=3156300 RepID=UPI00351245EA